jgi:hypothetical protein
VLGGARCFEVVGLGVGLVLACACSAQVPDATGLDADTDAQGDADSLRGGDARFPADGFAESNSPRGTDARSTADVTGELDGGSGGPDASRSADAPAGADAPGRADTANAADAPDQADTANAADALGHPDASGGTDASLPGDAPIDSSTGAFGAGAHVVVNDIQGFGVNPMTSTPVDTTSGSTFVTFVASVNPSGSVSDNKGNSYTQVGTWLSYATMQGFFSAWACVGGAGGAGHTFAFNRGGEGVVTAGDSEATLFAVEVKGGPPVDTFAQANTTTNPINAGNVTTTHAGDVLLISALGASYSVPDNYTPSAGYTLLDEQTNGGDSMAGGDAFSIAGAPGSYAGTLASSLANPGADNAIFLVALGR